MTAVAQEELASRIYAVKYTHDTHFSDYSYIVMLTHLMPFGNAPHFFFFFYKMKFLCQLGLSFRSQKALQAPDVKQIQCFYSRQ